MSGPLNLAQRRTGLIPSFDFNRPIFKVDFLSPLRFTGHETTESDTESVRKEKVWLRTLFSSH